MTRPTEAQLRALGESLREIDPAAVMPDEDCAAVRWFLGDSGTELFVWHQPGQAPHHMQLVFARVSVEWNVDGGLKTGTFTPTVAVAGGRYDPYILEVASTVDPDVCVAAAVLLRASTIEPELVAPLVQALEGAATQ